MFKQQLDDMGEPADSSQAERCITVPSHGIDIRTALKQEPDNIYFMFVGGSCRCVKGGITEIFHCFDICPRREQEFCSLYRLCGVQRCLTVLILSLNIRAVGEQGTRQRCTRIMERAVTINILSIQVSPSLFEQAYDLLALGAADGCLPIQSPNMRTGSVREEEADSVCIIVFTGVVQDRFTAFVRRVNIIAGTELRVQVGVHAIRVGHGSQQLAAALQGSAAIRGHS